MLSLCPFVNPETNELASNLGTNGLAKQKHCTKIVPSNLVICMKHWKIFGFVIFTCHMSSHFSFSMLIYLLCHDYPQVSIVWKLVLYPVKGTYLWFLLWPPEIASCVDGSYWTCFIWVAMHLMLVLTIAQVYSFQCNATSTCIYALRQRHNDHNLTL